jgi:5-(carboxyamino)imidazole ribonucleotide mutase
MTLDKSDVAVIMGSQSDWSTMSHASETLKALQISHRDWIVSAHRTPDRMFEFAKDARIQGYRVIIAGAGGAAHLPGMVASLTQLPVIGVPCPSSSNALNDDAAVKSILMMPGSVPVATMPIGKAGAINAALFAARILGLTDSNISAKLADYIREMREKVAFIPSDEPTKP